MNIFKFKTKLINGEEVSLSQYKGSVLVIVNTASKCGFTPQYEGLQKLYEEYKDKGLIVLGFPCNQFAEQEPGDNKDVQSFCQLNYGVTFPMFEKVEVRGKNAHSLFKYLTKQVPFQGFDLSHPIGKTLNDFLYEKLPKLLDGDSIKWNFTKFLIDKDGKVISRFEPTTTPESMKDEIERLL